MNERTLELIKVFIPKFFRYHIKNFYRHCISIKARKAFSRSALTPEWLSEEMIDILHNKYPYPPLISYQPEDLKRSAERRVRNISRLLGVHAEMCHRYLDIGCSEGTVCDTLRLRGKFVAGIDIRFGFNNVNVHNHSFAQMDAARLGFADGRFDCVFSFASFEHFCDPKAVMDEAVRVVRKGGFIYLHFGPLYLSSYGLHAYRSITVPYCQCLFEKETLTNFCRRKNLQPPDYGSLNQWTLQDFRRLWSSYASKLRCIRYYEYLNTDHIDLIKRYPSCFKSKTDFFDNLVVPEIEIFFQKT